MASRVNTKFVVVLAGTLGLLFAGVAAVAVYVTLKSAAQNISLGDKRYADGDYEAAAKFYSTAVAKEPTNLGYIEKWQDALTKTIPDTQMKYQDAYQMLVGGIMRTVGKLKKTDVAAHRQFLEALYEQATLDFSRKLWESVRDEVTGALRYYQNEPPSRTDYHALRRYRGVANLSIMLAGLPLGREEKALAREDLDAAIKADPADAQSVVWLSLWHYRTAADARANLEEAAAAENFRKSAEVLDEGAARLPGDPRIEMARLRLTADTAEREVDRSKPRPEVVKEVLARLDSLRPRLRQTFEVLQKVPPAELPLETVSQFASAARRIDPENAGAMTQTLLTALVTALPEDLDALYVNADTLVAMGKYEDALAAYQRVADLKLTPVCLSGLRLYAMRPQAVYQQSMTALEMYRRTPREDKAELDAALARMKAYRETLTTMMPPRAPALMYLDANIRAIEGDMGAARRLLVDYNKATDNANPEALSMLANIAIAENELGLAKNQLELLLKKSPDAISPKIRLAQVFDQLKNYAAAKEQLQQVLALDPENKMAAQFMDLILAKLGEFDRLKDDPVRWILAQAQLATMPTSDKLPDYGKGAAIIEEGLTKTVKGTKEQDDPRLYESLIKCYMSNNNMDAAKDAAARAVATNPNNAGLRSLKDRLDAQGDSARMADWIRGSGMPQVEQLLALFRTHLQAGDKEKAEAALDELRKSHLNDARAVDLLFSVAIDRKDMETALKLEERAKEMDVDRCDGLTFTARRQRAEGNVRDAATTMQRAVAKGTANAAMYRLLGILLLDAGQPTDALAAFESGMRNSPDDSETAKMLMRALIQLDRPMEALASARQHEQLLKNDPEFREMWITLEAAIGNKQFAKDRRIDLLQRDPKDRNNAAALAGILIQLGDWARARELIARLRSGGDDLRLVGLDARWHAEQGDMNAATQVYMAYIEGQRTSGKPPSPDPYIAFGQFLVEHNQVDLGLQALQKAAEFQDPKTRRADIARAEVLYRSARFAEASDLYKQIVDSGIADPTLSLRKRLVDALIHAERWAEAESAIEGAGAAAATDLSLISARSQAAQGSGDGARARRILDDAIAKFPSDPVPLYRRARLSYGNKTMVRDAMADLDAAIKLSPGYTPALLLRSALRMNDGKVEESLADLRAAADSAPGMTELLFRLLRELLKRDREEASVEIADAALKTRAKDLKFMVALGDIFESNARSARAVKYYGAAFGQAKDPQVASRLVRSLLRVTPINVNSVETVLAAMAGMIEQSPDLLMARATLRSKQGRMELAVQDVQNAYGLALRGGPSGAFAWNDQLKEVMPGADQRMAFVRQLTGQYNQPAQRDLLALCTSRILFEDPARRAEGYKLAESVANSTTEKVVKSVAFRLLLSEHFNDKNYEAMVADAKAALALTPDEWDLNNNLAAILAENLNQAKEALPFAEKAVAGNPASPNVLDTLGTVYIKLGEYAKAEETLLLGLKHAVIPSDRATVLLRLAELKVQMKNPRAAADYADKVRELLADNPDLMDAATEKKLNDLNKSLASQR